jgi:hypothetical protein
MGSPRQVWLVLGFILTVFVSLASVIAIKTPAWESADEPGHVRNIETLASGHWYGMNSQCRFSRSESLQLLSCSGDEAHQAPLYYLLFAGWQGLVGLPARAPFNGPVVVGGSVLSHGLQHQQGLFSQHRSADHRFLLWLRLPNVLMGALTVILAFFAVRLVSSDPWTPVVGASVVAFLPRFVFLSSFVTNDNLVNLLGAVLTVVALRYARTPSGLRMAAVGFVVGLLLITKLSALPIAIVLVMLAFMASGWKRRAEFLGIGLATTIGVSGWYFVQNTVRYGDPLARSASARYLSQIGGLDTFPGQLYRVSDPLGLFLVHVPVTILNSFWYQSGWNQFFWPWPVNLAFSLMLAAALAGLVHRRIDRKVLVTLLTIVIAGFLSVWLVATQTKTYEGRYALVGLAAIAVLAALGVERWRLPVRFLLPTFGLIGTIMAIQLNVLAVNWA